ncbi:hypothetical protein CKAH01_04721 [Colletotrichum kahawae]|uniref:Uncharacterized protein n=1 Tax=Colletotrichum kahawae TaxID=34407 RepID=A0AAE0D8H5_COLKA|nr:hypothetical protein CKAH01_04721 [Colletotrichum kahawae]
MPPTSSRGAGSAARRYVTPSRRLRIPMPPNSGLLFDRVRPLKCLNSGILTGGNRGSKEGWNMHQQQQRRHTQFCAAVKPGNPQLCALASTRYLRPVSTLLQPASSTLVTEDRSLAKTLLDRKPLSEHQTRTGTADGRRRLE